MPKSILIGGRETTTARIWPETMRTLKVLAAAKGLGLTEYFDTLAREAGRRDAASLTAMMNGSSPDDPS